MPKNARGREIAEIIPDKCIGCQLCLAECPVDAIRMEGGVAIIDREKCIGCGECVDVCPSNAVLFEKPRKKKPAAAPAATPAPGAAKPVEYHGVAVFIEVQRGAVSDVSWELAGKARELAAKLQTRVLGLLLGSGVGSVAKEAIAYGCDTVYVMDNPLLGAYFSRVYGRALVHLCQQVRPEIVLIGATPLGRDLSSVVATQLQTGLTADCTGLDIESDQKLLAMTRPTFGGNIMATIFCRTHRPQMSTVRPRVMKMPQKDPARTGEIIPISFPPDGIVPPKLIEFIPRAAEGVDITRSPVLVVAGKGACDPRSLPMLEELAQVLGGTIACSRPVIQARLLPYLRQVGQTGKTVAPQMYIGVGVSGAVQHLVGMQGSRKIIAINTDRNAPLVKIADYALIGDYHQIVPELIKGFQARAPQFKARGSNP